jgi:hypothetical protein
MHTKRVKTLGLTGLAAAAIAFSGLAQAEPLPVYILAGQSNLVGAGIAADIDPALAQPNPDILYQFDVTTQNRYQSTDWIPFEANGWDGNANKKVPFSGFGPEVGFANTIANATTGKFAVIKVAQNGTNLTESWNPNATTGDMLYQRMLDTIDRAIAQLDPTYTPSFEALVWVQGSGDAYTFDGRAQAYDETLALLVQGLRDHVGTPDLAVALNQYHADSNRPADGIAELRASQAAFVASDPYSVMIDADDLLLSSDMIHFEPSQQLELGNRLGSAVLSVPEPGSAAVLLVLSAGTLAARRRRSV